MARTAGLGVTLAASLAAAVGLVGNAQPQALADTAVYEGELEAGVRAGAGVLTWADGTRYEGGFERGVRHGIGTLRLPSGDVYTGDFKDDAMTGAGRFEWANGDVYEGDFVNGERSGRGEYAWNNGARYRGEVRAGAPHGLGTYEYHDGTVYNGRFDNGVKAGQGELLQDGMRYSGAFVDDERHGLGHYRWRDGTLYRGFFAFDRQNGPGVKESPTGELSFEVWDAGRLVAATNVMPVERCALAIEGAPWMFDGDGCVNGLAHGRGTAVRLDGRAYIEDGRFVLGAFVAGELSSLEIEPERTGRAGATVGPNARP